MSAPALVEHFFRHEYGRLVAMLSCRVGVQHVEDVEDAVQFALMKALERWTKAGLPNNPSANRITHCVPPPLVPNIHTYIICIILKYFI